MDYTLGFESVVVKVRIRMVDSRSTVLNSNVYGVAGIQIILGGRDLQSIEYPGSGTLAREDHRRTILNTTSR